MDLLLATRAAQVRSLARSCGFERVGFAPAEAPPRFEYYLDAIDRGYHGTMGWLAREDAVEQRRRPELLLPGARTLICVAVPYDGGPPRPSDGPRIARYAQRPDYHQAIGERLEMLAGALREQGAEARVFVDGGPLREVAHAARAGLGWIGKNTLLLDETRGSWWLLGEVLTTLELPYDEPAPDRCGTCTRCLQACPTGAFPEPYRLDARRCISYLTIEQREALPAELRPAMGEWVFGCDLCQEVCPWSRRAAEANAPGLEPDPTLAEPDVAAWLALDGEAFQARFRATPLWRAKRRGVLRNVCVALGNRGDPEAVPALLVALDDDEPLVRAHAAWALGRLGGPAALAALKDALHDEADPDVRRELTGSLERWQGNAERR